ncbi:hypothetical protein ALC53_13470 [Atta colombica]|uniref:Uncharacterized protein n=1 Tax=Atta colombica TaxID=520822 RepID=A0A195AVD2_9HYME|nr:hypothetical protein ALC53_13470 [Atta colombica]
MSPGGDERTDLRQVGESTASLFCSGPTTAYESPGPTWGWIVLAASLVLLDDVSAYFKRIGARKGYQGYHSYQIDRSGRLVVSDTCLSSMRTSLDGDGKIGVVSLAKQIPHVNRIP